MARYIPNHLSVRKFDFEVVDLTDCKTSVIAVFDKQRGSCETVVDSWIAGSLLGWPWSSAPELIAFCFKVTITSRDDDELEVEDDKEITPAADTR